MYTIIHKIITIVLQIQINKNLLVIEWLDTVWCDHANIRLFLHCGPGVVRCRYNSASASFIVFNTNCGLEWWWTWVCLVGEEEAARRRFFGLLAIFYSQNRESPMCSYDFLPWNRCNAMPFIMAATIRRHEIMEWDRVVIGCCGCGWMKGGGRVFVDKCLAKIVLIHLSGDCACDLD